MMMMQKGRPLLSRRQLDVSESKHLAQFISAKVEPFRRCVCIALNRWLARADSSNHTLPNLGLTLLSCLPFMHSEALHGTPVRATPRAAPCARCECGSSRD